MGQIIYQIIDGSPDFTAMLNPTVFPNQIHNALGIYSFDNVPDGNYTLTIIDGNGCRKVIKISINPCILEGTIVCDVASDCILEGEIECDVTTTSTTTV